MDNPEARETLNTRDITKTKKTQHRTLKIWATWTQLKKPVDEPLCWWRVSSSNLVKVLLVIEERTKIYCKRENIHCHLSNSQLQPVCDEDRKLYPALDAHNLLNIHRYLNIQSSVPILWWIDRVHVYCYLKMESLLPKIQNNLKKSQLDAGL